jgi:hypothetical protein
MVNGVNVDVERTVPGAVSDFEQTARRRAASAVNKDIEPAKRTHRLSNAIECLGWIGNVGCDRNRLATKGLHISLDLQGQCVISREPTYRDVRTATSKLACGCCADAAASSSDQANLSL